MTTINDADLHLLLEERAISRLLIKFARYLDEKNFEDYAELYDVDGSLVTPWGEHHGRAGLADKARRELGGFLATQHVSASHDIDVAGDAATVRAGLLATHVEPTESGTRFWTAGGHYDMELAKKDGSWLLTRVVIHPAWRLDYEKKED